MNLDMHRFVLERSLAMSSVFDMNCARVGTAKFCYTAANNVRREISKALPACSTLFGSAIESV